MNWPVIITVAALVAVALVAAVLYAVEAFSHRDRIGEELVIKVIVEQLKKETERKDMAPFDKNQRRLACMQRFERMAVAEGIKLPENLAARIHAQLTIKGK